MAIIKNAEIHFVKCNPKRPNAKYNKKNPTWECQIRAHTKEKKEELVKLGLKPKAVRESEEGPVLYWRVNLRKKSIKEDGEKAGPVRVVDGNLNDVDPDTIGNGSIANVRIFQYGYKDADSGEDGKASVLMGIQLVKHILYKPKARDDDFEETETEIVSADDDDDDGRDESDGDGDFEKEGADEGKTPSAPPKKAVAGF